MFITMLMCKISLNLDNWLLSHCQIMIFIMAAVRYLEFLKCSHLVIWLSVSTNVLLCTKFHQNLMIFRRNTILMIFKIADFRGPVVDSLKSPYRTSNKSPIEIISVDCLVFEKITFSYTFW